MMSHQFKTFVAVAFAAMTMLAAPASAQQAGMKSATPQQKDAWGEDIVRYCAAQIQTFNREEAKRFNEARQHIADVLEDALVDNWGAPKSYGTLEVYLRNAATARKNHAENVKNGASAAALAEGRWKMAKYDANACIASRAMYLLSGARETVTVWNKSPDTVDVWLNNAIGVCTAKPGQYCNVAVPIWAPADIVGGVGGVVKYGPHKFDPVGDGARTIVLGGQR
jgi:hypothetical protein